VTVAALDLEPHTGSLCERYVQAQLGGNRREALRLVVEDGLARGLTCLDLHKLIQRAQMEIGRLWQEDRITIAQEHMATAISQVVLSHIYQYAEVLPANGKKVLVACVENELHEFPARLVADALDLGGFEVRYLGASVPTHNLLGMLDAESPDLLVLSATMSFHVPQLRDAVRRVREHRPGLPIAIGGGACAWHPGLSEELSAELSGSDAHELVEKAKRLLGVQT
jgi:methanogenic corrinoid protein MtbC1